MPRLSTPTRAKSYRVRSDLLQRIRAGHIPLGECIPSEPQLVRELGVSRGTVRQAIRGLVRDGIVETRPGVGHVVRSPQPRKTIGLLFGNDYFQPFHRLMLEAFEDELHRQGFRSRLYVGRFVDRSHVVDHTQFTQDLRRGQLVGVFTVSWSAQDSDRDRALGRLMQARGVPCVSITNVPAPGAVGGDAQQLTHLGTQHLLARGCRRVALMYIPGNERPSTGLSTDESAVEMTSYQRALREAGAAYVPELCCNVNEELDKEQVEAIGFHQFKRLWREHGPFEGALILDDVLAKGAIAAAVDLGLDIPGDVRFTAVAHKGDDLFTLRPFDRLEVDPTAYAHQAMTHMMAMLENPEEPPAPAYLQASIIEAAPSP